MPKKKIDPKPDADYHTMTDAEWKQSVNAYFNLFANEKKELMEDYKLKYCTHWKKTDFQFLQDYQDRDKFFEDFTQWKIKHEKN